MCSIKLTLGIIIALVGVLVYNYNNLMQPHSGSFDYPKEKCKFIKDDHLIGPEDFEVINDFIITGTDDRMSLWEISTPAKTPQGNLFAIHPTSSKVKILKLHDWPEGESFHPHGLGLWEDSKQRLLYVLNHAYAEGAERIEVFKIKGDKYDDVKVEYVQTIVSEEFSSYLGTFNDLVITEPGKFYVSKYRAFGDCPDGRDFHSEQLKCKINGVLNVLALVFKLPLNTIYHCSFDPNQKGKITKVDFTRVSDFDSHLNGISYLPNENLLLGANPIEKVFNVYKIDPTTHKLTKLQTYSTIISVDNFIVDKKTGIIYGGGLVISEYVNFIMEAHSINNYPVKQHGISGGVIQIQMEKDSQSNYTFKVSLPIYYPGNFYSGTSVVANVDNLFIIGSWYSEGLVICR